MRNKELRLRLMELRAMADKLLRKIQVIKRDMIRAEKRKTNPKWPYK